MKKRDTKTFIVEQNGTKLKIYNNLDFHKKYKDKTGNFNVRDKNSPKVDKKLLMEWHARYGFFNSLAEAKIWTIKAKIKILQNKFQRKIVNSYPLSIYKKSVKNSIKGELKKLYKIQDKMAEEYPEYYI